MASLLVPSGYIMSYQLTIGEFKGPLDKLLELIEGQELKITQVNLAQVTADFLKYLKELEQQEINSTILADFLVVASKLLLIKSKSLLPSLALEADEETEIRELEIRLKLYQELKKTQTYISELWQEIPQMTGREFLVTAAGKLFYPPTKIKKENIHEALKQAVGELEKIFKPTVYIKTEMINLKAKIEEVLKRLTQEPTTLNKFSSTRSRKEIIVLFLAILHLLRDQSIQAEQSNHFEDIRISLY